jgi:hypothetical protein
VVELVSNRLIGFVPAGGPVNTELPGPLGPLMLPFRLLIAPLPDRLPSPVLFTVTAAVLLVVVLLPDTP